MSEPPPQSPPLPPLPPPPPLPPLVLVAGLAGSGLWWHRVEPALAAAGHEVMTIDLPGFGSLGGHGRLLPIVEQAEWLAGRLEGLSTATSRGGVPTAVGRVDLVGYSLGGSVAIRVAAARPALVRRLVLVAPGGVPSARGSAADAASLLHMAWLAGPSFWPTMLGDVRRSGRRALAAAGRDVRTDDATAFLPRIAAPTLVLHGDRDTLVPRGDVALIAAGIAGARLELLPGVGHTPMAECPEQLAVAIARFLAGEAGAEAGSGRQPMSASP